MNSAPDRLCLLGAVALLLFESAPANAEEAGAQPDSDAQKAALSAYQALVGSWRSSGTWAEKDSGGPWQEKVDWAWEIGRDSYRLVARFEESPLFRSLELAYHGEAEGFRLEGVRASGETVRYAGKPKGTRLTLEEVTEAGRSSERVVLQVLHANRHLLAVERRNEGRGAFRKFAEVGATKEGVPFVVSDPAKACPVTGGEGSIAVQYQGKTYYVCCTGCRDVFEAEPARFLKK